MSYNFLTQFDSPNYTPASETRATWGRDRKIEKIAIHWWDAPSKNPSFEGVVAGFVKPGGLSAHFVATGTGRRVACLVAPEDNSWATSSANPYTISIECDPRCRDEDYDIVGELVAELRATYGNLPLMRHSDVVATACPGTWDLNRINQVASTKIAKKEDQFGLATTKVVPVPPVVAPPAPVIAPPVVTPPVVVPSVTPPVTTVSSDSAFIQRLKDLLTLIIKFFTNLRG